jgi:hypothetical protein
VGVPHLTCDQSHDATWNYPGTPHHHGVCGPSNWSWTLQQGNFDTSLRLNTLSYILEFSGVPEFRSSRTPRHVLWPSTLRIWPMHQHVKSPGASKSQSPDFLATYFGLRASGCSHPLCLTFPGVRLRRSTYVVLPLVDRMVEKGSQWILRSTTHIAPEFFPTI